jgi:hypothetical protein
MAPRPFRTPAMTPDILTFFGVLLFSLATAVLAVLADE